jgi:hypothetical protein
MLESAQMKQIIFIIITILLIIGLSSCVTNYSSIKTIVPPVQPILPTPIVSWTTSEPMPSSTPLDTPIPTIVQMPTNIPIKTLKPEQVSEILMAALMEPEDCDSPCFLGIIPGQTTFCSAKEILDRLGLDMTKTYTRDNHEFYEFRYEFTNGLTVSSVLDIQDNFVMNIITDVSSGEPIPSTPREWLAYSPEILITSYGLPSHVELWMDFPARPLYAMAIFYEELDLIVEYGYAPASLTICPLIDAYEGIRVWMGANPMYSPSGGVSLENAASMTIEQFSNLMLGNPEHACFTVDREAFPP